MPFGRIVGLLDHVYLLISFFSSKEAKMVVQKKGNLTKQASIVHNGPVPVSPFIRETLERALERPSRFFSLMITFVFVVILSLVLH